MAKKKILRPGAEVLIMGITFKENFPDVRNSKVVDIIRSLSEYDLLLTIFDPVALPSTVKDVYGYESVCELPFSKTFAAIIIAVNHTEFDMVDYSLILQNPGVLYDVKSIFKNKLVDGRL